MAPHHLTRQNKAVTILVVDDDQVDVMAVKRAFRQCDLSNHIIVASDGMDALQKMRDGASVRKPYLVLLDLNMPRMDGRETLAAIKTDDSLKAIPVVILTTSGAAPDIVASYQHRANAYVTKPFGLDDFEATVRQINRFFREVAVLPAVD